MSRSKLKDKFIEAQYDNGKVPYLRLPSKENYKNKHRLDEMPKNKPSKTVSSHCGCVAWLQEPGSFGGHKIHKSGHRMVSGIVRAKMKKEIINDIKNQLNDWY